MQKPSFTSFGFRLASLFAPLVFVAACADASATEETTSEPPYRTAAEANDRLIVRDDIAARLETHTVETTDEAARLVGYGRMGFAPDAAYAVRVPFPSLVERVLVGPGDKVKAGQALVELRSSDLAQLRAELSRAKVQARIQAQTVERLRPLVTDGTATARDLAEAEATLEMAQADLASAKQSLAAIGLADKSDGARYVLRAKTDGSVIRRHISVGERVGPDSDPAFLIGNPDRLVLHGSFPERDLRWLSEGARCFFTVHALGSESFEGTVSRVLRSVDPQTRAAEVICEPSARTAELAAEMVAKVEVEAKGQSRLLLPRRALLMKRDQWVAFVLVDKNVVERRQVRPGATLGERVQILDGLAVGERVVSQGAVLLDGELDELL